MVRDVALAALAGPGLVLGSAIALDDVGVVDLGGLVGRVVAVVAVAVALLVLAVCRRGGDAAPGRAHGPDGRSRRGRDDGAPGRPRPSGPGRRHAL